MHPLNVLCSSPSSSLFSSTLFHVFGKNKINKRVNRIFIAKYNPESKENWIYAKDYCDMED